MIFIEPPCLSDLEYRLRERGTESETTINLRLKNAQRELMRKNDFDYLILNDNLPQARQDLRQIVEEIMANRK